MRSSELQVQVHEPPGLVTIFGFASRDSNENTVSSKVPIAAPRIPAKTNFVVARIKPSPLFRGELSLTSSECSLNGAFAHSPGRMENPGVPIGPVVPSRIAADRTHC
jgi:hypothetical protein